MRIKSRKVISFMLGILGMATVMAEAGGRCECTTKKTDIPNNGGAKVVATATWGFSKATGPTLTDTIPVERLTTTFRRNDWTSGISGACTLMNRRDENKNTIMINANGFQVSGTSIITTTCVEK